MVVWADILVAAVLHAEALWYGAKLHKAKALIKVTGMDIALHHSIELQNTEAVKLRLLKAVKHQLLADMETSALTADRIAGIADMSAAPHVIGVEYIKSQHLSVKSCNSAVCLGGKELPSAGLVKKLLLRKGNTLLNYLIPYPYHVRKVGGAVFFNA